MLSRKNILQFQLKDILRIKCFATVSTEAVASKESETCEEPNEEHNLLAENKLAAQRDKSGLNPPHRNILYDRRPYKESMAIIHDTIQYKKRLLGRYGIEAAGVPAGIAWPSPKEVEIKKEYERLLYPLTIQESWDIIAKKKEEKAKAIQAREEEITKKLAKHDKWLAELQAKIAKKEADVLAAKARKDRLMEEVRRHFGFKIDPRDERFKEMLEKKEKEDKKKKKEARKQQREALYMEKLKKSKIPDTEPIVSKKESLPGKAEDTTSN
ncbi:growth arrest and DNA damage-inducible proteins-interacting protein 1 [Orussus abietinus]|uniref:growth arrest and DNA damage-inducible proteins-interacting protein 1 n=1 Tax=Orussus abietinus TaxID=222816 RepID=UPI0006266025|nr:growth arrest and DNA damage-inducible proteins-interacting protein 1 [Orussus abietinus]